MSKLVLAAAVAERDRKRRATLKACDFVVAIKQVYPKIAARLAEAIATANRLYVSSTAPRRTSPAECAGLPKTISFAAVGRMLKEQSGGRVARDAVVAYAALEHALRPAN
jgi:hypothetical protein